MLSILNNLMALQRKANCLTLMPAIFLVLSYSSFKAFLSKSDKYNAVSAKVCGCICKSKEFMLLSFSRVC